MVRTSRKGSTGKTRKQAPQVTLRKVGVRNPNAVCEVFLDKNINWRARARTPKSMRTTIEEGIGMDFEDLFNPASGSPLYAKSLRASVRRRKC